MSRGAAWVAHSISSWFLPLGHGLLLDPSDPVTITIPAHLSCLDLSSTCHPCPQVLCPCFYRTGPLNFCTHLQLCYTVLVYLDCCFSKTLMTWRLMMCPSSYQSRGSFPSADSACGFFLSGHFLFLPMIFSYPKTVLPCTCCPWSALKDLSPRLSRKHRRDHAIVKRIELNWGNNKKTKTFESAENLLIFLSVRFCLYSGKDKSLIKK